MAKMNMAVDYTSKKCGRPPRCWKDDIMEAMAARSLNEKDSTIITDGNWGARGGASRKRLAIYIKMSLALFML